MPRKLDDENRRADKLNPSEAGVRTGNPQLEAREAGEPDSPPPQRAPRKRGAVRAKPGTRHRN